MSYLAKSLSIPENERLELVEAFELVDSQRRAPPEKHLKLLFVKFNAYISANPDDMHCPDCRKYVVKFWKNTIDEWRKRGMT